MMKKSERINKWLLIIDNETRFEPVLLLLLWLRAKKNTHTHDNNNTKTNPQMVCIVGRNQWNLFSYHWMPVFYLLKIQFYQLNEHRLHHHQAKKKCALSLSQAQWISVLTRLFLFAYTNYIIVYISFFSFSLLYIEKFVRFSLLFHHSNGRK